MQLSTERLSLRPWQPADLPDLLELNREPHVNAWLGGPALAEHSADALAALCARFSARGWGVWRLACSNGHFLGLAGVQPVRDILPVAPAMEAVWRLHHAAWGQGYIVEAMRAVLRALRDTDALDDLLALVAASNDRSARTALRLGFIHDAARDFDHPSLPTTHPLRHHRVFHRRLRDGTPSFRR